VGKLGRGGLILLICSFGPIGCGASAERPGAGAVRHVPVAETALSRKYEFRAVNRHGENLQFFVREPRRAAGPLPAVFILAGFETGRESLDYVEDRDDLVLLSMNYPRRESLRLEGAGYLLAPFALRRIAAETVEGGVTALDYLIRRNDIDQDRIVVLGVSFGSPLALALAARDRRASAVVLIYGGGDLPHLARHNLRERPWWVPGWIIGPTVRMVLGDFEPLDHVASLAPRYLLMVSSRQDEMFPPASALKLFGRAGEPKKLIWYDTGHLDLLDPALVRRLTGDVVADLREAGYLHPERARQLSPRAECEPGKAGDRLGPGC
jgi:fermentation-respiration switch protein FrsA (DUF1100 family)